MLEKIKNCFKKEHYYYSKHARDEMEMEESGEIYDNEVCQVVKKGKLLKTIRMMFPIQVVSSMVEMIKTDHYMLSVLIHPKMIWLL